MAQDNIPIILKEQYSDGQLLGVDDFVRERDFHIQNRELLTRLSYTPGVLTGLAVQTGPSQTQVQVDAGVAIDSLGQQIILASSFVIELNDARYYSVGSVKSLLLLVAFKEEQDPQQASQVKQVPLFTLVDSATASAGQNGSPGVPLALVNVTASEKTVTSRDQSGNPVTTKVVTVTVQVDPSARVNAALASQLIPDISAGNITGPLQTNQIPLLGSDKIDWTTVKADQLPNLEASQIIGPLQANQIPPLSADNIDWTTVKPEQLPNLDASKIQSGQFNLDRIPKLGSDKIDWATVVSDQLPTLSAEKIDWTTVKADQLPNIGADKITGPLQANQIPKLDSDKIDWTTVKAAQIPNLTADKITGQLQTEQIPNLSADKIQSGQLSLDRLPSIPASKITGLSESTLQTLWAQDVAIYAQGLKLVGLPQAASDSGFLIGLLKTQTDKGQTYYGLGISFQSKLLSFTSPQIAASNLKINVYPERTLYNLASEVGANADTVTSVQFIGVDNDYAFNLLTPESQLPAASQGKLRSLVTVGTSAIDSGSDNPRGAIDIINSLRSSISPFSFVALADATPAPQATVEAMAAQLYAEGLIAAQAAPILVAQQPDTFINHPDQLIQLLTNQFKESTQTAAQMAWALSAAGIPPAIAVTALAGLYQMRDLPAGVFPSPAVYQLIITLQEQGKSALDAAAQIKQEDAQYDQNPLELGILLRLNFSDTANTPQAIAQSLKNAGYASKSAVQSALEQLFPTTSAQEIATAVNQVYPA